MMKVTTQPTSRPFTPFTLTFHINTPVEAEALKMLMGRTHTFPQLLLGTGGFSKEHLDVLQDAMNQGYNALKEA